MDSQRINETRYRTLLTALALAFALSSAAAVVAYRGPAPDPAGTAAFAAAALLNLLLLPLAWRARREESRRRLLRLGMVALAIGFLVLFQRVAWTALVLWPLQPQENPFRPVFHFLPFFYIAAVALLPAQRALRLCWAALFLILTVTLGGLVYAGVDWRSQGALTLLAWMGLANPLFILLLHALPQYEAALAESNAEMERMRERSELMDRLAESEHRFNLVMEGLQVGVWDVWLGREEKQWWSPRFYELLGYAPGELQPSEETFKSFLHPEDAERVFAEGRNQLRKGDYMDVNFRLRTREHGYRWFNSHAKVERDAQGRVRRVAGAITDIHDRRLAEQALQEAQAELRLLVYRDTLTRLHNRRFFDEYFEREWGRAGAAALPLSLLLIDLDYFKSYNDCYGHQAGDQCLQQVAEHIAASFENGNGLAARLGGEEFGVLLPEVGEEAAEAAAERVRAAISDLDLRHDASPLGRVTASVGVGTCAPGSQPTGPAALFEQADKALYEVKRTGRNGVLHARRLRAAA